MDRKTENPMEGKWIPATSVRSGAGEEVVSDVYSLTVQIVNVSFVGDPESKQGWVLVDAGMPGSADDILSTAADRFGGRKPTAIILTHGHFDHVGAVVYLAKKWNVPVYTHPREMPYLTGRSRYPEPDATVEGGWVAKISPLFPTEPVDLGGYVKELPEDGRVPGMEGWRWLHTPGHTPGHISLYRKRDRSLLAGDAFVTVRQDSVYQVMTQAPEVNGPPRYLTTDWQAARESVRKLASLEPAAVVTGHGRPMAGEELSRGLEQLARDFDRVAVPDYGRYVDRIEH
ncbi:glyoxylase-like metal-dependent hydrolase (beta-lactamase superfamily II) [Melghirimyces profundicolus]|uniref:Glyoxylase-like metal-dependent hydrolase (Beta-lactamase superfamily II) n=2 Tax=Melghirimyces profundicolus TaxID=1242148 RepID=A0A2T6BWE6_9BACL|nr:MBL fold metallo-hydrolase [Melghirimyces profundicolus]PTX60277.1 glyoxylase-like metal-dependent hydrolase (beta-lactamase superfamily II) [Melghirimyces profundicolus]